MLKTAIEAAKAAGEIVKNNYQKKYTVKFKKDNTLVTESDLKAQRKIIDVILEKYPNYNIIAEEALRRDKHSKEWKSQSDYTWTIDPIDGTTNYVMGVPIFACGIGLLYKNEPVLGVVYNPITQELYHAKRGEGAYLNGKKISVSKVRNINKCMFAFTKTKSAKGINVIEKVGVNVRTYRSFGSALMQLCYLARGSLDISIVILGKDEGGIWDLAPGVIIAQEAGGYVSELSGRVWTIQDKELLTTNSKDIAKRVLNLIK